MAATKLLWQTMDPAKGAAAMEHWLELQVELSGVFDGKSAALAADYIKKFRIAEGFPGGPIVGMQDFDEEWAKKSMSYNGSNKVQSLINQGMSPAAAMAKVAPIAMAAAQRLTLGGGRRVLDQSALANPVSSGWRRVSSGSACAFCAMLVSRGPAYKSEKSAGAGRHWHKKCGCTVEEIFDDAWTPTEKEQEYLDTYNNSRKILTSSGKTPTTSNILDQMRKSGKFSDSPKPPAPKYTAPVPHPTLGPSFRVSFSGQVWKGYKYKVHGKEGVSWKKVNPDGSVLPENKTMPTKKQLKEQAEKAAAEAALAAQKAAEEAAAAAAEAAKKAAEEALQVANAKIVAKLGPNFRVGTDGTIWKGYKYKIQGKEGVSWKKVDENGVRIHKDPPTKKQLAAQAAKKEADLKAKIASEAAKKVDPVLPPVVLKNDYQKQKAAEYGWGQPELQAWVKSGKTMVAYHQSLLISGAKKATKPPTPFIASPKPTKVETSSSTGGHGWASDRWPPASAYTSAEVRGFASYTGSGYRETNNTLRSTGGRRGANAGLDQAFKRPTSRVPNDTVTYRGVSSARALGLNADTGDLSKLVGSEYVEHGYMSTAVEGGGFGGNIKMTVKIPKGHPAIYVSQRGDPLSVYGTSEKELLLDRGTKFKIVEAVREGQYGPWNVIVEVVPPPVRL
ncbi:MAG TPA: ADP-ribosyltransferase [Rhodoglobus sp.]|nr:ADP-ribosyltransferase [Rhodoglobus sp.]